MNMLLPVLDSDANNIVAQNHKIIVIKGHPQQRVWLYVCLAEQSMRRAADFLNYNCCLFYFDGCYF